MKNTSKNISQSFAWLIWYIAALFYFYEYGLRTSPAIMIPELKTYLSISYSGLGFLVGAYYYTYAPMQIVAGGLMDGYGGKKILPLSLLLCIIGSFLFIQHSFTIAFIGRLLMGAGSAFGFVGILYIATNWINKKHFSLIIGLTQAMGMIGAICGQALMAYVDHAQSWKAVWWYFIISGIILMILLLITIPKRPQQLEELYKEDKFSKMLKNLKIVFLNKQTWFASIYGGLIFIPTTVVAMLWGIPFLQHIYNITKFEAAHIMTLVFVGWIIGSPLAGKIDDKLKNHKLLMYIGLIAVLILFLIIVYVPTTKTTCTILLFLMGLFSSVQIITFTVTKESNPEYAKGSAVGITNFIVFACSAILIPVFGVVLHFFTEYYPKHDLIYHYSQSMLLIPAILILAGISLFFVKETYGQQQTE